MFALCTKHKLSHACVDFGCWSSLNLASLQTLVHSDWRSSVSQTYQAARTVTQCTASLYVQNHMHTRCKSKKPRSQKYFLKKMSLSSLCLFHFWVFICEGSAGCMTATCAAYAACENRPVPNRKFLLWNSIAVIRGRRLQTLGSGDFTHQPWFAHLALAGWNPL